MPQAVEQLDEHHPVLRALIVLASKCRINESTSEDHGFVFWRISKHACCSRDHGRVLFETCSSKKLAP